MTKSVLEYARPSGDVKGSTDVAAHLDDLSRMVKRVLGDGISDTGLGMDEATRQRAFEAFYTTKGAASEQRGTGLGLSSVFLIVNRAGGGIRVESTPGEGTMFTVDLPIAGGRSA